MSFSFSRSFHLARFLVLSGPLSSSRCDDEAKALSLYVRVLYYTWSISFPLSLCVRVQSDLWEKWRLARCHGRRVKAVITSKKAVHSYFGALGYTLDTYPVGVSLIQIQI